MFETTIQGTVYGAILNDATSLHALGDLAGAPYKGTPQAPVLYIKPANTWVASGAVVRLPHGTDAVEVAATVGLVLGRSASRLRADQAMDYVAGLVLAADLSLPHGSYYRPAIREKCFDGALPMSGVLPLADVVGLGLVTQVDGQEVDRRSLQNLLRSPAQLLAEVSEWMTLNAGDVLLVGVRYQAPQAKAGSRVQVTCPGLASIEFTLAAGAQA